ncbi:MAG: transcriptional regulator, partial [Catenulispora sp.]|nr:transcriptional regulator [Catenulispora sp.]
KLSDLIGELATRSDEFGVRWARHNVLLHRTTVKRLRSPVIGDIELTCDALDLSGDNLVMITYTAEAGSPAQEQLDFLASWRTRRLQPGELRT